MKRSTAEKHGAFGEQARFFNRLLSSPRAVGAIAPSGSALGHAMAAQVDPSLPGRVLELGPGSGAITQALLEVVPAPRLTVIERDPVFARLIGARFDGVTVLTDDAFALRRIAADGLLNGGSLHGGSLNGERCTAVVSGLPLLNFPVERRRMLLDAIFDLLAPGAPFIQFTYGLKKPVEAPPHIGVTRTAFIWRNIPPAHVWVYRRA